MTAVNGYYWMMDDDSDSIVVKTDDGTLAYSYPLDTTIDTEVVSFEYDGRNVWTLRATNTNELTIERWYIHNYICTLRNQFVLAPGPNHLYDSKAFAVEHYHTSFSVDEPPGESVLSIQDGSKMSSGYTVVLGPNANGQVEEKTVSSASANSLQINGATTYSFEDGDPISFYKRIWLFNNYDGTDDSTGALYAIDAYTGSVITKYAAGAYKDIRAATFFDVPRYVFDRSVGQGNSERWDSLAYVKGTNLLFLNPDDLTTAFGSMTMDNIEDDQATNITIYDLAMEGTNIYRLQRKATYYGTTGDFNDNTYNYQLSTLNSFITSISMHADPAILPANNVNNSTITAIVKDQFNLPVQGRQVFFTDDDPAGNILASPVPTDPNGVATTTYRAGIAAREVRITATAQQA
jgi:hypothetical protein